MTDAADGFRGLVVSLVKSPTESERSRLELAGSAMGRAEGVSGSTEPVVFFGQSGDEAVDHVVRGVRTSIDLAGAGGQPSGAGAELLKLVPSMAFRTSYLSVSALWCVSQ